MRIKNMKSVLIVLIAILITMAASISIFQNVIIPNKISSREAELRSEFDVTSWETVSVVIPKVDRIPAFTVFNDTNTQEYFVFEARPKKFLTGYEITNLDDLKGKFSRQDLYLNQAVLNNWIYDEFDQMESSDREVEARVKFLVGDTVSVGNLIDVSVNYGNGLTEVVLSKVKVKDIKSPYIETVRNEDGTLTTYNNTNPANRDDTKNFIVILELNEQERTLLKYAEQVGYLDAQKYIDETQDASPVTFTIDDLELIEGVNTNLENQEPTDISNNN